MKTKIFLSLLIVIGTVGFAFASSNEREESVDAQNISMAEMEFVSQCYDLNEICKYKLDYLNDCIPEVIIIDKNCKIIASGVKASYIIKHLMHESDYLSNVLGTEYYSLNYEITKSVEDMMVTM